MLTNAELVAAAEAADAWEPGTDIAYWAVDPMADVPRGVIDPAPALIAVRDEGWRG